MLKSITSIRLNTANQIDFSYSQIYFWTAQITLKQTGHLTKALKNCFAFDSFDEIIKESHHSITFLSLKYIRWLLEVIKAEQTAIPPRWSSFIVRTYIWQFATHISFFRTQKHPWKLLSKFHNSIKIFIYQLCDSDFICDLSHWAFYQRML